MTSIWWEIRSGSNYAIPALVERETPVMLIFADGTKTLKLTKVTRWLRDEQQAKTIIKNQATLNSA